MARGTLIAEAPARSGALITAAFALEHGRDLWVARQGMSGFSGAGSAKLALEGAVIIDRAGDILKEWGLPVEAGEERHEETGGSGKALASSLARSLDIEL
jgi:DNA processing protein